MVPMMMGEVGHEVAPLAHLWSWPDPYSKASQARGGPSGRRTAGREEEG